ncbi:MAG TPA: HepT-like ribonuclease domain-containing protein [Sphingobacteriaceae bacterium]|nr:HepT-like ribonuclease domain-containing protein [Sphingobacteriaceae bacterium]
MYALGSVLTDKFNTESDIDLLVDFETLDVLEYADNYFDLKFALQDALWTMIIKAWLYDILNAINEIEGFFIETSKEFQHYQSDLRTKRAVERNIEIIGEAMNRILKKSNSFEISNSRKLVDVRNRIIHGYDSVSDEVIWGIVILHLPVLQDEVEKLLGE